MEVYGKTITGLGFIIRYVFLQLLHDNAEILDKSTCQIRLQYTV